jgi:hypothetical protein
LVHILNTANLERSSTSKDFKEEAELHWKYTEELIKKTLEAVDDQFTKGSLEMMRFLYVMAMIHGYKHAKQEDDKIMDLYMSSKSGQE